ncbi:MAG: hypothetical protein ACC628_11770 [Pirellulaceae bacterium]
MRKHRGVAILAVSLFLLDGMFAANEVDGEVIKAARCSRQDVQKAVDAARAGDTVLVPPGTATWNTGLSIGKGITLKSAGIDKTTLVNGGPISHQDFLVVYDPDSPESDEPFRITGFTLDGASDGGGIMLANKSTDHLVDKVRVDRNKFVFCRKSTHPTSMRAVKFYGLVYGLVDHNIVVDCRPAFGFYGRNDASWKFPLEIGSDRYLYFEDNNISGADVFLGGGWGGRFVFRYNAVDNHRGYNVLDAHGNLQNDGNPLGLRGTVGCEIYGNVFSLGRKNCRLMDIRGGTCIMFENRLTGEGVTARNVSILLREEDCHPRSNLKTTYPGYDPVKDTYIWNNTCNGKLITPAVEEFSGKYAMIKLGRDYWLEPPDAAFYTPYSYPHPLTLLDVQEAGTVLLLHFDESKGGLLVDASGRRHDMALPPGLTLVLGRFGRACRLNGKQSLECLVEEMEAGAGVRKMYDAGGIREDRCFGV